MTRARVLIVLLAACARAQAPATARDVTASTDDPAPPHAPSEARPADDGSRPAIEAPPAIAASQPPAPPSSLAAGSLEATMHGRPIHLVQAVAAPIEDGTALVVLSSVAKGCSLVSRKGQAEVVFGMVVPWTVGEKTDVGRLENVRRPYAIVFDGEAHDDGSVGRTDARWNATGTIERIAPREPGGPPRVSFDLDGDCCWLKGEMDVHECGARP